MSGHPSRPCAACKATICDDRECLDVRHAGAFGRFAGDESRWCHDCIDRAELLWSRDRLRELEAQVGSAKEERDRHARAHGEAVIELGLLRAVAEAAKDQLRTYPQVASPQRYVLIRALQRWDGDRAAKGEG
jgi:hypothetical protein